jgi:hypothetical protein
MMEKDMSQVQLENMKALRIADCGLRIGEFGSNAFGARWRRRSGLLAWITVQRT